MPSVLAHWSPCHQSQLCYAAQVRRRARSIQSLDNSLGLGSSSDQGLPHGLWWSYGPQTSTQYRFCRAMNPDMTLSSRMGWDNTVASVVTAGYSHHAGPHHPHISKSPFLYSTQTILLLLFFLSHLSATYLLIVMVAHPSCPLWQWAGVSLVSLSMSCGSGLSHLTCL